MPTCRRCKFKGPSETWGRYTPTKRHPAGKLHALCPACDDVEERSRTALAQAQARGYASVGNTPEYKRRQAEREAQESGRQMCEYLPLAERQRRARISAVERIAEQIRRSYFRDLLQHWNQIVLASPDVLTENREKNAAQTRSRYREVRKGEVARVAKYKLSNPERVTVWGRDRRVREQDTFDGSATKSAIAELKRRACQCAYCATQLTEKQTDHMNPLALGGAHSLRNIVIACPSCNGQKAALSYAEWIDRVAPEHRSRVIALYQERHGRATERAA